MTNESTALPAFWNPEVICEGSAFSMLPEDVVQRNAERAQKTIRDLNKLLDEAEPIYNFRKTMIHGTGIQEFGTIINRAITILDEIQKSSKIAEQIKIKDPDSL